MTSPASPAAEMKALERLPAEDEHHRQQDQQDRKAKRDPRRRALAQDERAEPEGASGQQNEDAGAREIEDDRGDDESEAEQPDDPAFSAVPDIILAAGQDHDRGQAEKIGRLIAIWKRAEAALVVPERKGGVSGMECDAKRGEQNDASREKSKLLAHFAQIQIERADVIKPAQAGQKTDKAAKGNPRLRRERAGQADPEIVLQTPDATPVAKTRSPAGKPWPRTRRRRAKSHSIRGPSESLGGSTSRMRPSSATMMPSLHFSVAPPRKQASTGKRGDRNIPPPPGGSGGKTGADPGSLFLHWQRAVSWYGSSYLKNERLDRRKVDMDAPVLPRVEHGPPSRTLIIGFAEIIMVTQRTQGLYRVFLLCQIVLVAVLFWFGVWVMVTFYSAGSGTDLAPLQHLLRVARLGNAGRVVQPRRLEELFPPERTAAPASTEPCGKPSPASAPSSFI